MQPLTPHACVLFSKKTVRIVFQAEFSLALELHSDSLFFWNCFGSDFLDLLVLLACFICFHCFLAIKCLVCYTGTYETCFFVLVCFLCIYLIKTNVDACFCNKNFAKQKAVKLLNKKICKTFSKLSEYKRLSVQALQKYVAYGLRFGVLIWKKILICKTVKQG